ncbi:phosphate-starvation-inducible PsiE family protein [Myxacorys almedinensis]|nr:phosphate-starvation-inducible PsiE family protein [Myxacorys almedinensis]
MGRALENGNFLRLTSDVERWVSKVLALAMLIVIFASVFELITFMVTELFYAQPIGRFGGTLFATFGLFLNVLIAFEILENITAYLKHHVVQAELVIVTSLIAVARKIIILDLEKTTGVDLIALAAAILALAISYWIVRKVAPKNNH